MVEKNNFSFSSQKRKFFRDKVNFLLNERKIKRTEICQALDIYASRLSKMLRTDAIVKDEYIDILINDYGIENPFDCFCGNEQTDSFTKKEKTEKQKDEKPSDSDVTSLVNRIIALQSRNEKYEDKFHKIMKIMVDEV